MQPHLLHAVTFGDDVRLPFRYNASLHTTAQAMTDPVADTGWYSYQSKRPRQPKRPENTFPHTCASWTRNLSRRNDKSLSAVC